MNTKSVYVVYQDDITKDNIDSTIISVNSTESLADKAFNTAIDNIIENWDIDSPNIEQFKTDSFFSIENNLTYERIEVIKLKKYLDN